MFRFFPFRPKSVGVFSIFWNLFEGIKESLEPEIPAEYWANKELYNQDVAKGLSNQQLTRNLRNKKYYIPKEVMEAYPTPHREELSTGTSRIIIENYELYREDCRKYGVPKAHNWMRQGKYNLNDAELEITKLKFEKKMITIHLLTGSATKEDQERITEIEEKLSRVFWDCNQTEALKQWQIAHDLESKYRDC